jgi:6-phosphofructokinase
MGSEAVLALMHAKPESPPVVIGIRGNQTIYLPLMEAVEKTMAVAKAMADKDFEQACELRGLGFVNNLQTQLQLSKIKPKFDKKSV